MTWVLRHSMDAITLLRADHKTVEQLFKRFEKAGDRAYVEKRQIVDRIIEELSMHAAIEEQVFYPVARETVPNTEDIALESLEEHHIVKWVLSELVDLDPAGRALRRQGHRLDRERSPSRQGGGERVLPQGACPAEPDRARRSRRRHGRGEEVRSDAASPALARCRTGNAVVGAIAGVVDRVGDNVSGIAQGTVSAVQDLIARITGSAKPKVSPTGSTVARTAPTRFGERRRPLPTACEQTARSAKSAATTTAKTAASGAKATATTAKKSARATKTTAKRAATTTGHTAKAEIEEDSRHHETGSVEDPRGHVLPVVQRPTRAGRTHFPRE